MEGRQIDGTNILEVYHTISEIAEEIRLKPRPVLVECMTFRIRGHEEASGTKYVPQQLMDEWALKDPIANYEEYLLDESVITPEAIQQIRAEFKQEIEQEIEKVFTEADIIPDLFHELKDVYKPAPLHHSNLSALQQSTKTETRY